MEPGCLRTQGGSLQGCPFTPQVRYPPHRHLPPLGPELPTHSLRSGGRSSSQHNGEEHPRGPPPPQGSTLVGRPTPWQQGSTQRLGSGCGRTPQSTAPHRAAGGGPPWAAAASGPRERPRPSASRGCHGNRARGWSRPPTALGAISGTAAGRGREGRGGAGRGGVTSNNPLPSRPLPAPAAPEPAAASGGERALRRATPPAPHGPPRPPGRAQPHSTTHGPADAPQPHTRCRRLHGEHRTPPPPPVGAPWQKRGAEGLSPNGPQPVGSRTPA